MIGFSYRGSYDEAIGGELQPIDERRMSAVPQRRIVKQNKIVNGHNELPRIEKRHVKMGKMGNIQPVTDEFNRVEELFSEAVPMIMGKNFFEMRIPRDILGKISLCAKK